MFELPQITTEQENEKFYEMVASNVKRLRNERKISQLETALSIGQQVADFTQIWKTTPTASALIYFIFLNSQSFLNAIFVNFLKKSRIF